MIKYSIGVRTLHFTGSSLSRDENEAILFGSKESAEKAWASFRKQVEADEESLKDVSDDVGRIHESSYDLIVDGFSSNPVKATKMLLKEDPFTKTFQMAPHEDMVKDHLTTLIAQSLSGRIKGNLVAVAEAVVQDLNKAGVVKSYAKDLLVGK